MDRLYSWRAAGVNHLKAMKKELEEKPEEFLAWFERTTSKLVGARNLVPETMWEGYKLLNLTGLQEQDIFYDER